MDERTIRADERAQCVAVLRALADEYVDYWGPTVGYDAAKADAWNIRVAAQRMVQRRVDSAGEEP